MQQRSMLVWLTGLLILVMTDYADLSARQIEADTEDSIIEGRVISGETGMPLMGAHVFLSGTTNGSVTNADGRYRLRNVKPGVYRVVVSMIGFGYLTMEQIVGPAEVRQYDVELEPVVYQMDELIVHDEKWQRNLERFTRLFIGESERADSVKIVNPEVLTFKTRWWGRFTAEAHRPLVIENFALGYRITYFLDEFRHSGSVTRWDGDPLFEIMPPADSLQLDYWEQNRREAYEGSLRHLLLSLIDQREGEEGFILYLERPRMHYYTTAPGRRMRSSRLIHRVEGEEHLYEMNFRGRLQVIYTRAPEDERYLRWERNLNRRPADRQTSWLELNTRPITIDSDGEIMEVYGATRFGFLSYQRVAEETPREYRPD